MRLSSNSRTVRGRKEKNQLNTTAITIRVPEQTARLLKAHAALLGQSQSQFVLDVLSKELRKSPLRDLFKQEQEAPKETR